jgi:hypothetical protein
MTFGTIKMINTDKLIDNILNGQSVKEAVKEITKSGNIPGLPQPMSTDVNPNDVDNETPEQKKRRQKQANKEKYPFGQPFTQKSATTSYTSEHVNETSFTPFDNALADKLLRYFDSYVSSHKIKRLTARKGDGVEGIYLVASGHTATSKYFMKLVNPDQHMWSWEGWYQEMIGGHYSDPTVLIKQFIDKYFVVQ